jgi:alcohol dehydrogenase
MTGPFVSMQVAAPAAAIAPAEVEPAPLGDAQVRVRVEACGVCRADVGVAAATDPAAGFPITPGHEVAGTVAALGSGVSWLQVGDPVAVGWFGGSCGHCRSCRAGDVVHCPQRMTPGVSSSRFRPTRSPGFPTG